MAGDVLHQIFVHYGDLDVRQLIQTMDDRESAKDALMSSLRQEIVVLEEGFHRLQDIVVGQQRLIATLIERMDKGSTASFHGY